MRLPGHHRDDVRRDLLGLGRRLVHRSDDLIPLIAKRLNPGGVLAFSQAEPIEGYYGPQAMYGNGLSGRKLTVLRWNYAPETWADLLKRAGFTNIDAHTLEAPDAQDVGTLMVRARVPE